MTDGRDDRALLRMTLGSVDRFVFATTLFAVSWTLLLIFSVWTTAWDASQASPGRVASTLIEWNARYFAAFGMVVCLVHGVLAVTYGLIWGWRDRLGLKGEIARIVLGLSMTVAYLPILVADRVFEVPVEGWPTFRSLFDYAMSVADAVTLDMAGDVAKLGAAFWVFGAPLLCAFVAYPLAVVIRRTPRKFHRVF